MVKVILSGMPTKFDSLQHKGLFLYNLYKDLLELADELETNDIEFISDKTFH